MFRKQKGEQRISNLIDASIRRERNALKNQQLIRVLLLGQAESGKSTTLRNFRLKHAYDDWVRERAGWRCVIQLNLIRSILAIIDVLQDEMNYNGGRLTTSLGRLPPSMLGGLEASSSSSSSSPSSSSSSLGERKYYWQPDDFIFTLHIAEHIQSLLLMLDPLREVEGELKLRLGAASEEVRPEDGANPPSHAQTEFSVARWNNVLEAAAKFGRASKLPSKDNGKIRTLDTPTEVLSNCREGIKSLWTDETVRSVLKKHNIVMEHSAGFFLDDLDRIAALDYEPTDEDVLRARLRTVGVQEYKMRIHSGGLRDSDWTFYDVGGARTKRASWIPFFDNVDAIIFLAPVSTFDEHLLEDPKVNRFQDSLELWNSICSSKLLAGVTLVLLLNKCDILKRKLNEGVRVAKYLPDYNRQNDAESFLKFVKKRFLSALGKPPHRVVYCYPTTIVDMKTTSNTLGAVQDDIIRENLRRVGFV